jgi:hypothetical protein
MRRFVLGERNSEKSKSDDAVSNLAEIHEFFRGKMRDLYRPGDNA